MKPAILAGIVLVALGGFIVFKGLSYGSQRDVMRVGDLQIYAEERQMVPTWVGGVAIVGGLLLAGTGALKRRSG